MTNKHQQIIEATKREWNKIADPENQWHDLNDDERQILVGTTAKKLSSRRHSMDEHEHLSERSTTEG